MTGAKDWRKVTKEAPCPICGKDHACKISVDGAVAMCKRFEQGAFSTSKGWYFHRLGDSPAINRQRDASTLRHRPATGAPRKTYSTADAAIEAAGRQCGGSPVASWIYHRRDGREALRVVRYVLPNGSKEYRPIHPARGGWRIR